MNKKMDCGIYKIENLKNGHFYIGSSIQMKERITTHKRLLRNNEHTNPALQNAWNKYGPELFKFSILVFLDKEERLSYEDGLIKSLLESGERIYNIAKDATAPMLGRTHTAETRAKMSARMKGNQITKGMKFPGTRNPSKEHMEMMWAKLRGKPGWRKGKRNKFCKHGHLVEGENAYKVPGKEHYHCKICRKRRSAECEKIRVRNNIKKGT